MNDIEKAFELFDVLNSAIHGIEDIGEFDDYDLDERVESIYKSVEELKVDVVSILKDLGISDNFFQ
ncbi:MAG: hypothetical protein SPI61_00195, partial [Ezakiella sp.]|uniref:hypothetical protein n=1 Tax=Ezakiella sp. TaxID=1935205 RepID=UPI002A918A3E